MSDFGPALKVCRAGCTGAAFDTSRDTARTSQSRAELSREYRRTGSAVVSRAALGTQAQEYAEERKRARAFTSLPAVSGDLRNMLQGGALPQTEVAASNTPEEARGQVKRFWVVLLCSAEILGLLLWTEGTYSRFWHLHWT